MSALGSGRACSPWRSPPTVHCLSQCLPTGGGGRSIGPYTDSFPLSDHFQGGGGGGLGLGGARKGGGGLHTLTNMA